MVEYLEVSQKESVYENLGKKQTFVTAICIVQD